MVSITSIMNISGSSFISNILYSFNDFCFNISIIDKIIISKIKKKLFIEISPNKKEFTNNFKYFFILT